MLHTRIRRYLRHGTLPQLALFEAAARHASFTRAAEELNVAQPTASVHIKKLTDTVGVPLFEHVGRGVYLTEAGRQLYEACGDVFRAFEHLEDAFAGLRALDAGQLQLAASTGSEPFVARALGRFAKFHPHVTLGLRTGNRRELLARLSRNQDDLYVFANPPDDSEFVRQAIYPNPLVAFARADHPLAHATDVPLDALAREPFLMREPGSGTRMAVDLLFHEAGLEPDTRMVLSSNEAIRQALLAGVGVAIVSRDAIQTGAGAQALVALDVRGLPLEGYWYFVFSSSKHLSHAARAFIDFAREEARSAPGVASTNRTHKSARAAVHVDAVRAASA